MVETFLAVVTGNFITFAAWPSNDTFSLQERMSEKENEGERESERERKHGRENVRERMLERERENAPPLVVPLPRGSGIKNQSQD
jgi:hypothetical protein